jgi:hypothetical protein
MKIYNQIKTAMRSIIYTSLLRRFFHVIYHKYNARIAGKIKSVISKTISDAFPPGSMNGAAVIPNPRNKKL